MIDVLLATSAGFSQSDLLSRPSLAPLASRGLRVEVRHQSDPEVDWSEGRICLLHDVDPGTSRDALLRWAGEVSARTRLVNPASCVEWASDRSGLRGLDESSAPTLPTLWLEGGGPLDLEYQLSMAGWTAAIALPAIGFGQESLVRCDGSSPSGLAAAQTDVEALLTEGDVLLQPVLHHLSREGLRSILFVSGEPVATLQCATHPDGAPRALPGGQPTMATPDPAELTLARAALEQLGEAPTWAQVDVARDGDGEPCLVSMQLTRAAELFEYAAHATGGECVERLADSLQSLLD